MTATALGLALVAALATAGGLALQSAGVRSVRDGSLGVVALFGRLIRLRSWWFGVLLAGPVVGLAHVGALREGPILEVEAVLVTSLLFTLAVGARLSHQPVSRRDWTAAALVVVGLVLFLVAGDPHGDVPVVTVQTWVIVVVAVGAAVALLGVLARRATRPNRRAAAWGAAAGVLLGTNALLLKHLSAVADSGLAATVGSLALWSPLGVAFVALICQQQAYRPGEFAAAMAPIVGGNPLFAGLLGVLVYQERFHRGVVDLVVAGAGIVCVAVGIVMLTSSPMVHVGSGEAASVDA